jgi:hypothetical protein
MNEWMKWSKYTGKVLGSNIIHCKLSNFCGMLNILSFIYLSTQFVATCERYITTLTLVTKPNSGVRKAHFVIIFILKCWSGVVGRSQHPRCWKHEMSSPAQTLGSWIRILVEAWMFAFILFALSCVGSGLATGWSPLQGVLPTVCLSLCLSICLSVYLSVCLSVSLSICVWLCRPFVGSWPLFRFLNPIHCR